MAAQFEVWPSTALGLSNGCRARFLEGELARRYRDAAPATLALLAERCEGARAELAAAQAHLLALTDVPTLRRDGACCPTPPGLNPPALRCCPTPVSFHHPSGLWQHAAWAPLDDCCRPAVPPMRTRI